MQQLLFAAGYLGLLAFFFWCGYRVGRIVESTKR